MNSLILRTATRFMLPLLLLFSIFLLLRGHNDPGGGFSGGLVAASAFVLYSFSFSVPETRRAIGVDTQTLIGAGLLLASCSAILSLLAVRPFMTGLWTSFNIPGMGEIHLGTPLLFDVGVFLVVVGVALSMILSLAEVD